MKTRITNWLLAAIFALFSVSAFAAENVSIRFSSATEPSSTALTAAQLREQAAEGADCIGTIDYIERVFGASPSVGLKFGSGSGGGCLSFEVAGPARMVVAGISLNGQAYNKDDSTMGFWVNDDADDEAYVVEFEAEARDIVVLFDEPRVMQHLEIQTLKRCYLNSITFIASDVEVEPTVIAMPTIEVIDNCLTISRPEDADEVRYLVCGEGEEVPACSDLRTVEATTFADATHRVWLHEGSTVLVQAYGEGLNEYGLLTSVGSPMVSRTFSCPETDRSVSEGWHRMTYAREPQPGDRYIIAAPTVGLAMQGTMDNFTHAFDAVSASFSADYSMVYDVDPALSAVTLVEKTPGYCGLRFDNGTYISTSGENFVTAEALTGSGSVEISITRSDFAYIWFAYTTDRQLLYHEGYDFRYSSHYHDDNPAFAMPALYRYSAGGVEKQIVASETFPALLIDGEAASEACLIATKVNPVISVPEGYRIAVRSAGEVAPKTLSAGELDPTTLGPSETFISDSNSLILNLENLAADAETVYVAVYDPVTSLMDNFRTLSVDLGGVNNVNADSNMLPVSYFDLMGRPVSNPRRGTLVIRRQGGTATKTICF